MFLVVQDCGRVGAGRNVRAADGRYSALMLPDLITAAHLSVSEAIMWFMSATLMGCAASPLNFEPGITVGRRLGDGIGADVGIGTRTGLGDDGLVPHCRELVGDDAAGDIDNAAGGVGDLRSGTYCIY